jgi:hypothetical protein
MAGEALGEVIAASPDGRTPRPYKIDDFQGRPKSFPEFFRLERIDIQKEPDTTAKQFVDYLNGTVSNLTVSDRPDSRGAQGEFSISPVVAARGEFAAILRNEAEDFIKGFSVLDCFKSVAKELGRFEAQVEAIRNDSALVVICRSPGEDTDDLRFNLSKVTLTKEQKDLIIDLGKI